jgi:hypothetical protein
METTSPLYKFATLRNPTDVDDSPPVIEISPNTTLVDLLISINESDDPANVQLDNFNNALQEFIDSDAFIKNTVQFNEQLSLKIASGEKTTKSGKDAHAAAIQASVEELYNNVLVRTLTRSTTNRLYKLIVDDLKVAYAEANDTGDTPLKIVIPARLTLSFTEFTGTGVDPVPNDDTEQIAILEELATLNALQSLLEEAREDNVVAFDSAKTVSVVNVEFSGLLQNLRTSSISVRDAEKSLDKTIGDLQVACGTERKFNVNIEELGTVSSSIKEEKAATPVGISELLEKFTEYRLLVDKARDAGLKKISSTREVETTKYAALLNIPTKYGASATKTAAKAAASANFDDVENALGQAMQNLGKEIPKLIRKRNYSLVGDKWIDTTEYAGLTHDHTVGNDISTDIDCEPKFPFQIMDLRVVESQTVGYLPGEIAHINNTQPGEKNTKVTRRLKKVESFESLITEDEVFRETDTQSTEKFSLEREASNVQSEASSFNVNASVSGTYGVVTASVDAGYSSSSSSTNANSTSQSEAKEVVKTIVDRVSNRVRSERSVLTVEEFEEIVTHEIDNTKAGTKSYVYRWLNKLVRATLKNYGKRLIFSFDVAHPAHYYLSRAIKDMPSVNLPQDPRELNYAGNPVLTLDNIDRYNYQNWAAVYKTEIAPPPPLKVIVSDVINGTEKTVSGKLLPIVENYKCYKATITYMYLTGWPTGNFFILMVGNRGVATWTGTMAFWSPATLWLNGETGSLPVSVMSAKNGFTVNMEIECHLTAEAYQAWKIEALASIVDGYQRLKDEADSKLGEFNPNLPGLHPLKKKQLIRDEIKKETLRKMFRCNPFWINDKYEVGNEYSPECCLDAKNAEKVRFLESVFDWKNMNYELYPYYYADKDNWSQLLDLSDDDPHFEAFLQSSFASVQVPVFRDEQKEIAAVNFIANNSIANYEVVPADMGPILAELANNQPTLFEFDEQGNELPAPTSVVDLGVFQLPTSLVILECGTADGVKPIGFPESTDPPTSDVIIPKQYSPAIIADTCPPIDFDETGYINS